MKKLGIISTLILCLVLVLSVAGAAWAEDDGGGTYPAMQPDQETLESWIEAYNNAPRAYIRMEGFEVPSPAGSLDLLDHLEYTPLQRNQGNCGNCWAWAGTGVMEIALDVEEGIKDRLSVQYINSCQTGEIGKACCYGGWLFDLADFYTATDMAIPWSNTNAYWQSGDGSCGPVCGTISTAPNYPITSIDDVAIPTQTVNQETAIANIKDVLQQDRAVWFGFFMPNSAAWSNFTGFWGGSDESVVYDIDQFCGTSYASGLGHAVLCVGYNDTDPDNRYWVMLNSWGTDYGGRPNGLFRINMDMNYDCQYPGFGGGNYAFYWQTLDVAFGGTPDLVVSKSIEISGGNFTVSYNVSNIGNATANASTTGKYVNSTLMESQPCPPLGPGQSHSGQFDPEPCPCGESLNVTVCADDGDAVDESNEANNCEINIVDCPATPDIRVSPGGFNVTLPPNTTQDYTLTIGNDGCAALSYNISDREAAVDCPWLDENPASGSVGPGGSQNITVSINTTGLGSDYSAEIVIASNDPDEDPVIVPVSLHVVSPDLVVEKWVEISGGNFTVSYNVSNIGNAAANASSTGKYVDGTLEESQPCPALDPGENYSGQFDPESCPCGESLNVTVCADGADVVAESNEANNCEINIVDCPATPDIWVFPGGFNVTLPPNTTQDYTLTIGNDGCAALSYNISDREAAEDCPWLDEDPKSGSVGPGGSQNISVSINTTGLGSDYSAEIVIASNDPDEDPVIVPVALHVGWPVISYNITLGEEWNMISLPLILVSNNISEVLAGISGDVEIVWHYDAQTETWLWYKPGEPASTLTTIEDGLGYWIFMNSTATLNVSGQEMPDPPAPPPAYDVFEGWNQIGFKSTASMSHEIYLANIAGNYSMLWGYDPSEGYFNVYPVEEHGGNMEPGHGYWLWMNESGTIVPP